MSMIGAFEASGQFWKGNLHGHSTLSDGALEPAEVCARYRTAGYDFIALTDHFHSAYEFPIADTRAFRDKGFTTLIGAELHAPTTKRGSDWHILSVGLPLDFDPPKANESGPEIARRARNAGAFVAIAHPQWYQLTLGDGLALDAAHAVEVYNHTSHINSDRGDGLVLFDALLAEGKRLSAIAVDDSHWKVADAFGGWVMVKADDNTPENLLAALRAGHFYSTQGPEISDIRLEGGEMLVTCTPAHSIACVGPVHANVQAVDNEDGTGLTTARLNIERFQGGWCRVSVIGIDGKRAWSNPLWLD